MSGSPPRTAIPLFASANENAIISSPLLWVFQVLPPSVVESSTPSLPAAWPTFPSTNAMFSKILPSGLEFRSFQVFPPSDEDAIISFAPQTQRTSPCAVMFAAGNGVDTSVHWSLAPAVGCSVSLVDGTAGIFAVVIFLAHEQE